MCLIIQSNRPSYEIWYHQHMAGSRAVLLYTLRNILRMPAVHVCVKTCVFNCNKRAYREARVYRMVLNRLMWSWTISHGACLASWANHWYYYVPRTRLLYWNSAGQPGDGHYFLLIGNQ